MLIECILGACRVGDKTHASICIILQVNGVPHHGITMHNMHHALRFHTKFHSHVLQSMLITLLAGYVYLSNSSVTFLLQAGHTISSS